MPNRHSDFRLLTALDHRVLAWCHIVGIRAVGNSQEKSQWLPGWIA
jgi:hypothetical protein